MAAPQFKLFRRFLEINWRYEALSDTWRQKRCQVFTSTWSHFRRRNMSRGSFVPSAGYFEHLIRTIGPSENGICPSQSKWILQEPEAAPERRKGVKASDRNPIIRFVMAIRAIFEKITLAGWWLWIQQLSCISQSHPLAVRSV